MRSVCAAMSGSWVTKMTVMPCSGLRRWKIAMISTLVRRVEGTGRLVGQDDRRVGRPAPARSPRAAAARPTAPSACGPRGRPARRAASACERAFGALVLRARRRAAAARPARRAGMRGSRLKLWKTKPIFRLRTRGELVVAEAADLRRRRAGRCRCWAGPGSRGCSSASTCRSPTAP